MSTACTCSTRPCESRDERTRTVVVSTVAATAASDSDVVGERALLMAYALLCSIMSISTHATYNSHKYRYPLHTYCVAPVVWPALAGAEVHTRSWLAYQCMLIQR